MAQEKMTATEVMLMRQTEPPKNKTLHDRMIAYVDRLWFTSDYLFEQALNTDNKVDAAFARGQAYTLNAMATTILQWLYEYPPKTDKEWCLCGTVFHNRRDSWDHFTKTVKEPCHEHQLFRVGDWAWTRIELL